MGLKYRDNMSPDEEAAFVAEINLDEAMWDAVFARQWVEELGIAIWLIDQWEKANADTGGVPREEWDTERYRTMFCEDIECSSDWNDPVRMGWIGKDGRP